MYTSIIHVLNEEHYNIMQKIKLLLPIAIITNTTVYISDDRVRVQQEAVYSSCSGASG